MFHNARCWTSETKFSHLSSMPREVSFSLEWWNVLATCVAYMSHTWFSSFFYCFELLLLHEMMILCNNYFLEYYYVLSKEDIGSHSFIILFIPPQWEACPPPPCSWFQVLHHGSYDDDDAFQSCSCLGFWIAPNLCCLHLLQVAL